MVTFDFTQMYPNLAVVLFLLTGGMLLFIDVKSYQKRSMMREKSWARWLGWMNLSLGICLFIIRWIYLQWIW